MRFQFQLDGAHLNSSPWAFRNGYIEGDFQLYVDGRLFIEDPYMNVVELALQLGKWNDALRHGMVHNFAFESIDHDEQILLFTVEADGLRITSPWQRFEAPLQSVETVQRAVHVYLVTLNVHLHEMNYVQKLDRFLHERISDNTKAIMLFEQNEYDAAFALFKKLAVEAPSVQSMNNLAWIFLREEEDQDEAEKLLQCVLALQPQSPFPYMMLGEIALHKKQYEQAKSYLQQALSFSKTEEATYNLAMAHFQLGAYEEAAMTFARCIGDSGITQLDEVVAWMYAGKHEKARSLLVSWNEEADDYTGAIEIADVYVELGCYSKAREQFEKEWKCYVTSPYIVSRYAYTLWKLEDFDACQMMIQQAIQQNKEEIKDEQQAELDEHWTVQDRDERILELMEQQQTLEALWQRLENGYVPTFEYDMYPSGGCQLFGCAQHGNLEYEGI